MILAQDYSDKREYDTSTDEGLFLDSADRLRLELNAFAKRARDPVLHHIGLVKTVWHPTTENVQEIAEGQISYFVDPLSMEIIPNSPDGIKARNFLQNRIRSGLQGLHWVFEAEGFEGLRRETRKLARCGTAFQNYLEANVTI
tara:strand:+ start:639 stop:1067 length:429 start_codon:yes stop_codon:yes gene_type:complete